MVSVKPPSGEEFLHIITSPDSDDSSKIESLQRLKAHIKRDKIDLTPVPQYMQALVITLRDKNNQILSLGITTLSYLIKRVGVQDTEDRLLKSNSEVVVPALLESLGDQSNNIVSVAKRALETYWLAARSEVEAIIARDSFNGHNFNVAIESLRWLDHIVKDISPNFKVTTFLPHFVRILRDDGIRLELKNAVSEFLEDFYRSKSDKSELLHEFEAQEVQRSIQSKFIKAQDTSRGDFHNSVKSPSITVQHPSASQTPTESNISEHQSKDAENHLLSVLQKVNYDLDESIEPFDVPDVETLSNIFASWSPCFEGKESEGNWKLRENSIVQLRSILRGNATTMHSEVLVSLLKDLALGICKAASSLRTTLSTHTCQLLKECAVILNSEFDQVADLVSPTLIKLCANAKNITSNNANMTLSAFFANMSYSSKLVQRILAAADERNHQPRSHACIWLQIILWRFGSDPEFVESHGYYLTESTSKMLSKVLKDANPNVRQVAKSCYWCFQSLFPAEADLLMKKLDTNTVKALERSKLQSQKGSVHAPATRSILRPQIRLRREPGARRSESSASESTFGRDDYHKPSSAPATAAPRISSRQHERELTRASTDIHQPLTSHTSRSSSWSMGNSINSGVLRPSLRSTNAKEVAKRSIDSTREAAPSTPVEENARKSFSFTNGKDPIVEFLSSSEAAVVEEGVNLLTFAIKGNEELPSGIDQSLKQASLSYPLLLKPLFTSTEKIFNVVASLYNASDLLRVCSIVLPRIDEKHVRLITACISSDELYEVIADIIYELSNTNSIYDNAMAVHAINYGHIILRQLVHFILIALNKIPIADDTLKKLMSRSINLVIPFKEEEGYKTLGQLLCQLYSINPDEFLVALKQADTETAEEVEKIVGLDSILTHDTPLNNNIFELTEVRPAEAAKFKMSPVKVPVDFTMIVPQRHLNVLLEEYARHPTPVSNVSPSQSENVEMGIQAQEKNDKEEASTDIDGANGAAGLSDDFAQVTIDERAPSTEKMIDIQNMLDKLDPLRPISNKAQNISIYQDAEVPNPEPVTRDDKSTRWECHFLDLYHDYEEFGSLMDIEDFKTCCLEFAQRENVDKNAVRLISTLKFLPSSSREFYEFYMSEGKYTLANCIWTYFDDLNNMKVSGVLQGLALLNQNLKFDDTVDMTRVWALLNRTCKDQGIDSEVGYIWNDILHNIAGIGSKIMEESTLLCLENGDANPCIQFVALNYLSNVLSQTNNFNSIFRLDQILAKLLSSAHVDSRMAATICYGNLMKNIKLSPEARNALNEMKSKRPMAQQKILEAYCEN